VRDLLQALLALQRGRIAARARAAAQVATGAERVAGTGDDEAGDLGVVVGRAQGAGEQLEHFLALRVLLLGPVQARHQDTAVGCEFKISHETSP
jgi:hypothetical protein